MFIKYASKSYNVLFLIQLGDLYPTMMEKEKFR
jgi:hypothetical protein